MSSTSKSTREVYKESSDGNLIPHSNGGPYAVADPAKGVSFSMIPPNPGNKASPFSKANAQIDPSEGSKGAKDGSCEGFETMGTKVCQGGEDSGEAMAVD